MGESWSSRDHQIGAAALAEEHDQQHSQEKKGEADKPIAWLILTPSFLLFFPLALNDHPFAAILAKQGQLPESSIIMIVQSS